MPHPLLAVTVDGRWHWDFPAQGRNPGGQGGRHIPAIDACGDSTRRRYRDFAEHEENENGGRQIPRSGLPRDPKEPLMSSNVTCKLIGSHLLSGAMTPGEEIAIHIDQTLTQDATGTLVMQELEALGLERVRTEVSVQYVDHNLLQTDEKNAEDHEYLRTAAQRFGLWFSKPGNGVSHPTHMQRFGIPGKTMVGSDSHTPAAGSLGMLAIGVGGLEVALAMSGQPLHIRMPQVWGVRLDGELPEWCSAKDVILEMLRRHDVKGGVNRIIEYYGPGLAG